MNRFKILLFSLSLLAFSTDLFGQRQLETLGRGVVGMRTSSTQVYIGWRMLGTDPEDASFNLYRVRGGVTNKLNSSPITNSCNYVDTPPNFSVANEYFVRPIFGGSEQAPGASWILSANAAVQQYINLSLNVPAGGVSWDGVPYTYNANDCSVGDVDGDGDYEIILKWDPSNSHDNSQSGFTGNTILDCYKFDGTQLWRINLGPNIRSGAHYMDFMVYDFDGDGKAELMCRTAPGSKDGPGNYIGGAAKWQSANGSHPMFDNTHDYRFDNPNNVTNGYVLAGPEFLSVFKGETGEELATSTWYPRRDPDNNIDNPSASRLNQIWGDGYGNRLDRFLAGIAFCDGIRPSAIFCRGYYTRAYLAAWDWRNGQLSLRWTFNSRDGDPANLAYEGQGAHSLSIGDVDGDGRDEVVYGACVIDDDGGGLYSTGLGHGDAEHMSDMNPVRDGQEIWFVHECPTCYGPYGLEMHDSKTGGILLYQDGLNADIGRGVAIDIDPNYPGYEMWGSRGGLMNATGVQLPYSRPSQMNFACWWDADVLREILDGTTITKWNWNSQSGSSILSPAGLSSNNGTKSTPALSADLLGDWREEVIWRTTDNSSLRIYTTTILATNRLYTLMHDPQYRCAIAWQNTGYNQPPHPGFYLGPQMYPPPRPPISTAQLAWRGGNGGNSWTAANNWYANGIWTNDVIATYAGGQSVLFDLRGNANQTVIMSGTLTPGDITVYSPSNFTFSGSGTLVGGARLYKSGVGQLTINNTNTFTGGTFVGGGTLTVNGALNSSPVVVEARGEPWGRAKIAGSGWLGQGLVVQHDCGVVVGPALNATGVLTVSNVLTELGGVLNQFDLSNNPGSGNNDRIAVVGNVTLTGTNIIEINQLDGSLGGGVYPLITYTGTLSGGLTNLVLTGDFLQPVMLTNPPGQIALLATVPAAPPVAPDELTATELGAFQINLTWNDNSDDEIAYLIERSPNNPSAFEQITSVDPGTTAYQDIGLAPNTTYYYRVRGTNLAGFSPYSNTTNATTTATPPALVWKGDGAGNVWDVATTANWLNGGVQTLYANGSFVAFNEVGSNNTVINLSTGLAPGTLTVSASKNYNFGGNGSITGPVTIQKSGSGSLTITTTNDFSGGVSITNGAVVLGSSSVNLRGLGIGPITLRGGTLEFNGWTGNSGNEYYGNTNTLIVPAGETGIVRVPQRFQSPGLAGPLLGSGTLNLQVKYLRGDVSGNWSAFGGTIYVTRGNTGSTVDDFRVANSAGWPSARLNLGPNVQMYSRVAANSVIPIGAFGGEIGGIVTAGGCSGNCGAGTQNAVTWKVGGLNLDATNAALFSGTVSLIKEGNGQWTLTADNTYSGTTVVNGGTLVINGDQSSAVGDVMVNSGGTLAGNGVVGGNAAIDGVLAPGASLGTLSFAGDLLLGNTSTSKFEIGTNPLASDQVAVAGELTVGGTLQVLNTSIETPIAGDNFQLFTSSSTGGAYQFLDLPGLDEGLDWSTNRLAQDGTLWVVRTNPPVITSYGINGSSFNLDGSGGTPNWGYAVLTTTNLALPTSAWLIMTNSQFDASGGFNLSLPQNSQNPQQYYLLRAD